MHNLLCSGKVEETGGEEIGRISDSRGDRGGPHWLRRKKEVQKGRRGT